MAGSLDTNILSTYDLGFGAGFSNREDLADIVTIISPTEAPFFSSAPKGSAKLRTHEWLYDSLAAVSTAGAPEGADFAGDSLNARTRVTNVTQIFRKDIIVSDTQQEVDPAGVRNEYEFQVMKGMKELSRNVEAALWKVSGGSATGIESSAASNATLLKGFRQFSSTASQSNVGIFTTSNLFILHQTMFTAGANPDSLWVSPGVKFDLTTSVIADGNANHRIIGATDHKSVNNIDVIETPFGILPVITDRFIPQVSGAAGSASAFGANLLERSKARLAILRPFKHVPLPKNGDATRGFIRGELTLELLHPSCFGALTGVTASGTNFIQ